MLQRLLTLVIICYVTVSKSLKISSTSTTSIHIRRLQSLSSTLNGNIHSENQLVSSLRRVFTTFLCGITLAIPLTNIPLLNLPLQQVIAAEEKPSLDKCFNAVRREISPEGESIKRLADDIATQNWNDLKLFTREYDAGFRGYVMKSAWKQMDDESLKKRGIEVSNSFTFDLIALNKAARAKDTDDALRRLEEIKQDLKEFLKLDVSSSGSGASSIVTGK